MKLSLKAYRVNAHLTIKEASAIAEVHESTIARWEKDAESFKKASLESVMKLANAYGVSIDDLTP